MSYISAFKDFDPKAGALPPVLTGTFAYIADKARSVLRARDSKSIRAALPALDWLLHETELALRKEHFEEALERGDVSYLESPAETLRETMQRYEFGRQDAFPHATWAEYFAILALAIIGNTVSAPKGTSLGFLDHGPDYDRLHLTIAGEWAVEAMEAATWASILYEHGDELGENLPEAVKKKISLQNRKAAIDRHARTQSFKDDFVMFYRRGKCPSKSQAAKAYLTDCKSTGKDIPFKPTNAERTLLDHLRKVEQSED